jgi:hypothetical protein
MFTAGFIPLSPSIINFCLDDPWKFAVGQAVKTRMLFEGNFQTFLKAELVLIRYILAKIERPSRT